MEQVLRVERLRQAVLENLHVEFAKPLLPALYPYGPPGPYGPTPNPYAPTPMGHMFRGRGGPVGPLLPPGPKSLGRGRGILGNFGNNPFRY
jgi:hypothetical protein